MTVNRTRNVGIGTGRRPNIAVARTAATAAAMSSSSSGGASSRSVRQHDANGNPLHSGGNMDVTTNAG